jgi:transcriptional regulator with XRE-family HTH domain
MINEKLGENIRIFRTIKGYSQEGLANKLGKTQNWLQKIEKGEIDIPLSCLSLITNELGITLDLLLTFDPKLLLNVGSPFLVQFKNRLFFIFFNYLFFL